MGRKTYPKGTCSRGVSLFVVGEEERLLRRHLEARRLKHQRRSPSTSQRTPHSSQRTSHGILRHLPPHLPPPLHPLPSVGHFLVPQAPVFLLAQYQSLPPSSFHWTRISNHLLQLTINPLSRLVNHPPILWLIKLLLFKQHLRRLLLVRHLRPLQLVKRPRRLLLVKHLRPLRRL